MTVIARDLPSGEPAGFPAGGRPLEWRALEEAAAFEKWFEGGGQAAAQPGLPSPSAAERTARDESARMQRDTGAPAATPASDSTGPGAMAPQAARGADEPTLPPRVALAGHAQLGVASGALPSRVASAVILREPARIQAWLDPCRTHWSKLAVTAVAAEDKVKVWLRDYRLDVGDMELLRRELAKDLRKLGYGLSLLVLNGEIQNTSEGHHGD